MAKGDKKGRTTEHRIDDDFFIRGFVVLRICQLLSFFLSLHFLLICSSRFVIENPLLNNSHNYDVQPHAFLLIIILHRLFRNHTGALYAMKRKKMFENEVDKIQNVKMTMETQVMNLESAAQNAETVKAMEAGNKTMKKIRQEVGIDQVDDVMDSIKEEMEMANEINDAIAQPVDPLMADEDELLEELQELENADLEAELLAPPTKTAADPFALPDVPNSELPNLAKDEEDDLKQLEAELAGM